MPRVFISEEQKIENKSKLFGKWLSHNLSDQRISKTHMAAVLGVTRPTLNGYISGAKQFSYSDMLKIFNFLGTEDEVIIKWMRI